MTRLCSAILAIALLAPAVAGQTNAPCDPPSLPPLARERNIFTEEQEADLGDAIAEHVQRFFKVVDDPEATGYLESIGRRLVGQLPIESRLPFRFLLVDIPDANAFTLPGGRIYVSRKLVAMVQDEEELAGVIAHELGHQVARHGAVSMTRVFREVLNVTAVGDRRDVFQKYNDVVDNIARKPKAFSRGDDHENAEQLAADRIGLYVLARAGYDPSAFSRFFDRLADTKGQTGNFFTDLFGRTRPEAKRLREMIKAASTMPAGCVASRGATTDAFRAWQAAVVAVAPAGRQEALRGVKAKVTLEPPLRGEITRLRFSPDGQYVLAQDDAGIYVLRREPFEPVFRIPAPEAKPATFSADSREIAFHNSSLRVEVWDLASQSRKSAHELFVRTVALQTALSPDAKTLAFLDANLDLALYDVATGAEIFRKKSFYIPNPFEVLFLRLLSLLDGDDAPEREIDWITMEFSPDSRYFVAGARSATVMASGSIGSEAAVVAFDLTAREQLSLKGQLKKLVSGGFAFLSPDRLIGVDRQKPDKSGVVTFPEGKVVEEIPLGRSKIEPVARGRYVMLRPFNEYAVGVLDLDTKMIFKANEQPALDTFDDLFVAELRTGEIGLYGVAKNDLRQRLTLPRGTLGRLRAAAVSSDMKWLAVSERLRGAVWNLTTGERVFHMRGFRGGHFGDDGALFADFPEQGETKRSMVRMDLATRKITIAYELGESGARQDGALLVRTKPAKEDGPLDENVVLEMRRAMDDAPLWTKQFPKEAPRVWLDPAEATVVLSWAVTSNAAKMEIKKDARLGARLAAMREKEGDYYLQVLDARSGEQLGHLLVETGKGSFRITDVFAAGDWVVIADSQNRVLLYSLASGEQTGKVFGDRAAIGRAAGLLSVENEAGQLSLYDLATMERRDQLTFSGPVSLVRFSADGRSLFVLTADQTAYVIDLGADAGSK